MPIQLAMVGLVVSDMKRSLAFYRRLGLDIPVDADEAGLRSSISHAWSRACQAERRIA